MSFRTLVESWYQIKQHFPGVRSPLIHWTSFDAAEEILGSGELDPAEAEIKRDVEGATHPLAGKPRVSFTRTASHQADEFGSPDKPVGFVFDRDEITAAVERPQPYADEYGEYGVRRTSARAEQEERVTKPVPLTLLHGVLVAELGISARRLTMPGGIFDYVPSLAPYSQTRPVLLVSGSSTWGTRRAFTVQARLKPDGWVRV